MSQAVKSSFEPDGKMKSNNQVCSFPSSGLVSGHVAHTIQNSVERHHIVLLPIAALYLILGFYQIDDQSLWTDEVISINRIGSNEPISTRVKSQSSLYFLLLDLWAETAGTTEVALRSFSVLVGLAAIGMTYAIVLLLFNRRIAAVGAVLLATSPYFIWYAQEVRYVTLMLVTSLAMTYSFYRALSTSGRRWWVLYSISSALALFTFVTVVFLVIVHGLFLLSRSSGRPFLKKWVGSQLIIIFAFAVYVKGTADRLTAVGAKRPSIVSAEQVRSMENLPLTDLVGTIPYTFCAFSVGFSLGPA
jgi:uncharacterized membrane protein